MSAHAQLSPSKANRWLACPGSIREESAYPDEPSGKAAVDGTHTHTLLEHCIKGNLGDPMSMCGLILKDHEGEFMVDTERAARVRIAINYIKSRVAEFPGCQVISERRVNPEALTGRSDMSGTVDVQIRASGMLEIIDYKDGMAPVPVDGNPQLELYTLGVLAAIPPNSVIPYEVVRNTVIQPKIGLRGGDSIASVEYPVAQILGKVGYYTARANATDAPDAPLVAGDHCKYCKHKTCNTRAETVMKEVGVMFQPVAIESPTLDLAQQSANKDPATMTDDQLRQVLEAAPLMRQMLEAAEAEALKRLEAGKPVPGFKLVNGRGSRAWTLPEDQMAEKLIRMGVPKASVYVTKLVSPAQVEKLAWEATKGGEKVTKSLSDRQLKTLDTEYVAKLAGKVTIAPESDPRPAVVRNAAPLFSAVQPEPVALPDWLIVKS